MYSYDLLEPGCYYLVQEKESSPIELVRVAVESDQCLYVFKYNDQLLTEWKCKTDELHDILECLSDEIAENWRKQYYNSEDAYYGEDDE